jgi:hypothetical protein
MMVVVTMCFNCRSRLLQFEVLMIVSWLSTVYDLWISCIVSSYCTIRDGHKVFLVVWFHCNLIVKLVKGMESARFKRACVCV